MPRRANASSEHGLGLARQRSWQQPCGPRWHPGTACHSCHVSIALMKAQPTWRAFLAHEVRVSVSRSQGLWLVAINPLGTGVAVAAALKPVDDNAGDTTSFGKCASLVRSRRYPKENGIRTFSRHTARPWASPTPVGIAWNITRIDSFREKRTATQGISSVESSRSNLRRHGL